MEHQLFVSLDMPKSTPGDTGPLVWFTGISIQFQYPPTAANPEYYTMPVAGFNPYQDGYTFLNTGRYLYHNSGPGGDTTNNGWYWARAQLPDGATISSLTLFYSINSTYAGYAKLQRTRLGYGDFDTMATLYIPPSSVGDDDKTTTAISNSQVDNSQYAYWIVLDIPPLDRPNRSNIPFYATIGYTPPASSSTPVPVSIPAAAFTSYEEGYAFENHARYVNHLHSPGGGSNNGWYFAPVQLPQGAQVSKVQFYWHDNNSISTGIARLQRINMVGNYEEMATLSSDGDSISGFFGMTEDTSISNPTIDNLYHTYWVVWDLPVASLGDIKGCGMIFYYSYPLYLPVVRRAP